MSTFRIQVIFLLVMVLGPPAIAIAFWELFHGH